MWDMGRLGIYLPDDVEKRLKDYVYKKTGQFRGQSEVAVEAIKEYLDRHENELEKSENPLWGPRLTLGHFLWCKQMTVIYLA